jgi:ubiquitin carboxyl-terminal hydrolase 25
MMTRSFIVISQLADLFQQLEFSETPAITPTIELAKLALVTSRDEEEDEADKGGTDSSNDTDATLVDDAPSRYTLPEQPPNSPSQSPGSILGKRPRDVDKQRNEMDVDSTESFVMVSHQSPSPVPAGEPSSSKPREATRDADDDIEMLSSPPQTAERPAQKPPALPPRKPAEVSDSIMMFGKCFILQQ